MATRKQTVHNKKAMLDALEKSLGVITTACKVTGIPRTTVYQWLAKDTRFSRAVAELDAVALDFAESQLHKQIKGGSVAATIFYLKTKGKERGYIERQELAIGEQSAFVIEKDQTAVMDILHKIDERHNQAG